MGRGRPLAMSAPAPHAVVGGFENRLVNVNDIFVGGKSLNVVLSCDLAKQQEIV
jgi:hypothetical protein